MNSCCVRHRLLDIQRLVSVATSSTSHIDGHAKQHDSRKSLAAAIGEHSSSFRHGHRMMPLSADGSNAGFQLGVVTE